MLTMKPTMKTQTFIGGHGYLVIKQINYPDDDANILLSYEQAMLLSEYILQNKDDLKEAWNESKEEE